MAVRAAVAALAALAACGDNGAVPLTATPDHGSRFGHYDVTFAGDVDSLGDLASVTVGGIRAYAIRADGSGDGSSVTVTLQGAPAPGPADVVVEGTRGEARATFTYDPPVGGAPLAWMAFGASLTQGMQSLGLTTHSQPAGVSGVVAQQAGAYLGLPLIADGVLPGLTLADFTPDCTTTVDQTDALSGLVDALTDPTTGLIDLTRGRVDPDLVPRDVAVAGSLVSDVAHGSSGRIGLLEHLTEEPHTPAGMIFDQIDQSQIDRIVALDPDVGIATDLLANDIDGTVLASDDLHAELATPVATLQPDLADIAQRLGALHGDYFIANLPYLTFLPNVTALRAKRIAAGTDTADSFDAKVAAIDALTDDYNAALVAAMAPYANLHVVDFQAAVQTVRGPGIVAAGETCTVAHFGGLLSLDDLHFTDTGYAFYANVFVDAIDSALGLAIPRADVDAIHASDALAPAKLRAAGFTCVPAPD